jgi:hypothetical protein
MNSKNDGICYQVVNKEFNTWIYENRANKLTEADADWQTHLRQEIS